MMNPITYLINYFTRPYTEEELLTAITSRPLWVKIVAFFLGRKWEDARFARLYNTYYFPRIERMEEERRAWLETEEGQEWQRLKDEAERNLREQREVDEMWASEERAQHEALRRVTNWYRENSIRLGEEARASGRIMTKPPPREHGGFLEEM